MTYKLFLIVCCVTLLISCNSRDVTQKYSNGKTKEERIYSNRSLGNYMIIRYFENGKKQFEGTVQHNLFVGRKISYYSSGTIEQIDSLIKPCELDECCCTGTITKFDSLGHILSIIEVKNGKKNGLAKIWGDNGKYWEHYYSDDIKNGKSLEVHEDKRRVFGQYINGKEEGEWIWKDSTGKLDQTAFFKNGLYDSIAIKYANEKKEEERLYKNGKLICTRRF